MAENASVADKGPRCPDCGWTDVRLSMPRGIIDQLVRIVGLIPYRCRSCGLRFYRGHHGLPEPDDDRAS
jgi:hypothetical protein